MKILYFDDFKLGVLKGDNTVVDVSAVVQDIPHIGPGDLINGLIERFASYRAQARTGRGAGPGRPARQRAHPPAFAEADQYRLHGGQLHGRRHPQRAGADQRLPQIARRAIIGNGDTMVLPDAPATIFEGEAELAVIIGKRASNVKAADAMDYIFGYTNFIDGSARGLPAGGFFHMKSRDTFAPIGPYIVTADEITDPQKLQIRLWNNGTLMQNFNTDDMAHKIPRCIEWLTSIHTLEPGDIVATGTNHRGLNPFMDGDKIEIEIEGARPARLQHQGRAEAHNGSGAPACRCHEAAAQKTAGAYPDYTPQVSGKYAKAS